MGEDRHPHNLRSEHDEHVLDLPPALEPPAIVSPAAREVSFGLVTGTVPSGTRRVIVRVGARIAADKPLRGSRFSVRLDLPFGDANLSVTAVDARGSRSTARVGPVYGLPRSAAPRRAGATEDPALAATVRSFTRAFHGTGAVFVQDLRTGRGAAWNARARFPAASTLKLAIAATVLRALPDKPSVGSSVDVLLRRMLVSSDNASANALEVWLAGSTSAGSARVNETMRALGLYDSEMYGGYEIERAFQAPIPIRIDSQPVFGPGKYTTAWDLARLARAVYLAAGGRGKLAGLGVSSSEARYLLWVLAHVEDGGKLGRFLAPPSAVLHKAGWNSTVRHDAGLVFWPGGVYVAAVMTWNAGGVGPSSDVLAGRVAAAAFKRFRSVG
jgi:beta-lactamase class A